jgi:hypothetical protein
MPQKLTNEIITAAIAGFEAQKKHIDAQIAELRNMLNGRSTAEAAAPEAPPNRKGRVSAAVRRRMAQAQKQRWAKIRGESEPPLKANPKASKLKPKRKLSEAGRQAIIAATKKRWALIKAAKAQTAPPPKKATRKKTAAKKVAA